MRPIEHIAICVRLSIVPLVPTIVMMAQQPRVMPKTVIASRLNVID